MRNKMHRYKSHDIVTRNNSNGRTIIFQKTKLFIAPPRKSAKDNKQRARTQQKILFTQLTDYFFLLGLMCNKTSKSNESQINIEL